MHFESADISAVAAAGVCDEWVIDGAREACAALFGRQITGQTGARAFIDCWAAKKKRNRLGGTPVILQTIRVEFWIQRCGDRSCLICAGVEARAPVSLADQIESR